MFLQYTSLFLEKLLLDPIGIYETKWKLSQHFYLLAPGGYLLQMCIYLSLPESPQKSKAVITFKTNNQPPSSSL